jgi:hypothetical protein
MESDWSFVRTRNGAWMWKHSAITNKVVSRQSSQTFPTLSECLADAKLHGYNPKADPVGARQSQILKWSS